ncbi:MAG: IclR family transcriptional regulator [Propionibacteriaceae bacterium]|nr:IclR family transcriptional regulator [Propionibacteriaceae bacterium]
MTSEESAGISGIARALAVLSSFQSRDKELSAAELARRVGFPRSTVYRLVGELTELGALEQTPDGHYRLGSKVMELGSQAQYQRGLCESASPFLSDLALATRQATHLAVLDHHDVVFLDRIRPTVLAQRWTRPGGRLPASVTGAGKAILAFSPPEITDAILARGLPRLTPHSIIDEEQLRHELAKVRQTGVAFSRQEHSVGISCIGAPIFGEKKRVLGAVSVSGPASTIRLDLMAVAVQSAATGISRLQGWQAVS